MAARLINEIGGAENAGSLYQVLWAQDWGQGIVEVRSAAGLLYEAGYSGKGTRVQRTWLERMKILKGLGFVRTAPRGLEEHGFILLIDPSWAVIKLEAGLSDEHKASFDTWMVQFRIVCRQWGIDLESYKAKLAEVKQGGVS
jgi:hypothetical protein